MNARFNTPAIGISEFSISVALLAGVAALFISLWTSSATPTTPTIDQLVDTAIDAIEPTRVAAAELPIFERMTDKAEASSGDAFGALSADGRVWTGKLWITCADVPPGGGAVVKSTGPLPAGWADPNDYQRGVIYIGAYFTPEAEEWIRLEGRQRLAIGTVCSEGGF